MQQINNYVTLNGTIMDITMNEKPNVKIPSDADAVVATIGLGIYFAFTVGMIIWHIAT